MTREQAEQCLAAGVTAAAELADDGVGIVALGEMGIGNTTSASALAAAFLDAEPEAVCGPGTGLDAVGLERKVAAVRRALAVNGTDGSEPVDTLAVLGGFEIAFLAGVALGAADRRLVTLLDGFISGTAALAAERIRPGTSASMVAAHRSPEPGHALVLEALGLDPLLDLGLRLGEGSGAALALPILHAALAILDEMATFDVGRRHRCRSLGRPRRRSPSSRVSRWAGGSRSTEPTWRAAPRCSPSSARELAPWAASSPPGSSGPSRRSWPGRSASLPLPSSPARFTSMPSRTPRTPSVVWIGPVRSRSCATPGWGATA